MKAPYSTICVPEDAGGELLGTELDYGRAIATVVAHGIDVDEFEAERGPRWREPVTLRELRDFLGY